MHETWRESLGELFDAIRLESPEELTFGGRTFAVQVPQEEKPAGPAEQKPPDAGPFVAALGTVLYRYVYSHPFHGSLPPEEDRGEPSADERAREEARRRPDPDLLARLSAANATRERWEHGWSIAQVLPDGQIQAQRGNLRRLVWPGQFLSLDGPGAQPRPGAQISLFYSKESTTLQPGFYYLFGETAEEQSHAYGIMRLYWNVSPEGAPRLLGAVSAALNRFFVPFRMKCAVALGEYERTDVAVVYLPKRLTRFGFDLLPEIYPKVREHLADDVPFFSRKLAPGLSLAEDPGTGESFGQHRCRLVAEAVWNCFLREENSTGARLEELERLFEANGVHPHHCHMNAHSAEWYETPEELDERAA